VLQGIVEEAEGTQSDFSPQDGELLHDYLLQPNLLIRNKGNDLTFITRYRRKVLNRGKWGSNTHS